MKRRSILLLACTLLGPALAGRIPGTKVAYKVQRSGGKNTSLYVLYSGSDRSEKTYIAVQCKDGSKVSTLYSRVPLGTKEGVEVTVDMYDAAGKPLPINRGGNNRFYGTVRSDKQTGQLTVWEPSKDDYSSEYFTDFTFDGTSQDPGYTLMVKRSGMSPLKLHFSPNGMNDAYDAVKRCK